MSPVDASAVPDRVAEILRRTRAFIETTVLPIEEEFDGDLTTPNADEIRVELQSAAKSAGIFGPQLPVDLGGHALGMVDRAPVFEAAGRSLFGPLALGIAAPDEGNVHLLDQVADPGQREQYLGPLARGEVRSAFAMTEPAPGAGSDPSALATHAQPTAGGWVLRGRKWFITGADGAAFLIVMARTSGSPGDNYGATMFLVPADRAGLTVGRHVPTTDHSMVGGHCEVELHAVPVGPEDVLGEVDEGFRHAQVRLGPARITHVMRWLGSAVRAHEVALLHTSRREAFGRPLHQLGIVQQMIADNEIDLAAARSLLLDACRALDRGEHAAQETSITKTFGSEAICRVVDRAQQMCGGLGVSEDLPLARIAREVRPFRIYDGPSEVHRWSIARRASRRFERSQSAAE